MAPIALDCYSMLGGDRSTRQHVLSVDSSIGRARSIVADEGLKAKGGNGTVGYLVVHEVPGYIATWNIGLWNQNADRTATRGSSARCCCNLFSCPLTICNSTLRRIVGRPGPLFPPLAAICPMDGGYDPTDDQSEPERWPCSVRLLKRLKLMMPYYR